MTTVLAFAGSNSSTSINFQLVKYTTSLIQAHKIQLLNMAHLPFPLYNIDHEKEKGFSNSLIELKEDIQKAAGLVISVNEHNSNPSAFFKNLIDWLSRLDRNFLEDKVILLMATSGGKRGARSSLEIVEKTLPRFGTKEIISFSLPSFQDNFNPKEGITDTVLAAQHKEKLQEFLSKI